MTRFAHLGVLVIAGLLSLPASLAWASEDAVRWQSSFLSTHRNLRNALIAPTPLLPLNGYSKLLQRFMAPPNKKLHQIAKVGNRFFARTQAPIHLSAVSHRGRVTADAKRWQHQSSALYLTADAVKTERRYLGIGAAYESARLAYHDHHKAQQGAWQVFGVSAGGRHWKWRSVFSGGQGRIQTTHRQPYWTAAWDGRVERDYSVQPERRHYLSTLTLSPVLQVSPEIDRSTRVAVKGGGIVRFHQRFAHNARVDWGIEALATDTLYVSARPNPLRVPHRVGWEYGLETRYQRSDQGEWRFQLTTEESPRLRNQRLLLSYAQIW